jgi:hypothetical protein
MGESMPENSWVKMRKRLIFGLMGWSVDLLGKKKENWRGFSKLY